MRINPLISVIIPVYKVERYLPRCIESILRQTYSNFELILIDDGTPDRSGIICDRYAEKDSRIRVIHKENGGVSTARNAGIDAAKGEWVTFVDSDDWVQENYLEVLTSPLGVDDYDMTIGVLEWRAISRKIQEYEGYSINIGEASQIERALNCSELLGPWLKLFSLNIIKNNSMRFSKGIALGEDAIFVAKYLKHCKKIYMTGKAIYCYNWLNNTSVTKRSPYFEDKPLWDEQYMEAYIEVLDVFGADNTLKSNAIPKMALPGYLTHVQSIIKNFDENEAKKKIFELFSQYDKWIISNPEWFNTSENQNIKMTLLYLNRDVDAIYDILKLQIQNMKRSKVKQKIRKIICPLIEKYRDGLIKFKF